MNWCPRCLADSREGSLPPDPIAQTLGPEDLRRAYAVADHCRELLWDDWRPALMATGVPARHAVTHHTGMSFGGDTPADSRPREPAADGIGVSATEAQVWVPRWVWVVLDVSRRGSGDDFGLPAGARDAWLLELEDHPDLRDALLASYSLGGREGASALLPPSGPPRRPGARWAHLLPR